MDTEKSKKLYSMITLFAIIDIPLAALIIPFVYLIRVPVLLYGIIPVKPIATATAIAAAGVAVVALIVSIQGKAKLSEDEKTAFILSLLTLAFMGACVGLFGNLIGTTANTVGPIDHIITHEETSPNFPLAVAAMPFAMINLFMAIAGTALSVLGAVASLLNVLNVKGVGGQATARASSQPSTPPPSVGSPTGGSRFCAGCGAPLDAGSKFCQKCGKQV